ncbi:MAG: hypothetical protein AAGL49_09590 [Pseudomonadota bacterium]
MRARLFTLAVAGAGVLALSACGGSNDSGEAGSDSGAASITADSSSNAVADAYITEMTKVADALESVTDEESAQAAAAVIQSASTAFDQMAAELDGEMNEAKWLAVAMARQEEFSEVQMRLASSMSKLGMENPALLQSLSEEMENLPQAGQ